MSEPKKNQVICKCNCVTLEVIEKAIDNGADTLNKIFDETFAGVGACGGSCRKILIEILKAKKKSQANQK